MEKLHPRHEAFCQNYLLDPNSTRAAGRAGYSRRTARQAAWRLLGRDDIKARLAELRGQVCLDADSIVSKLEAVYQRSLEVNQCAAANRAVELQARMAGLTTGRKMAAGTEDGQDPEK